MEQPYLTHAALRAAARRSPIWTGADRRRAGTIEALDPRGRYPILAAYPAGEPGKRLCAVAVGAEHDWLVRVELSERELAVLPRTAVDRVGNAIAHNPPPFPTRSEQSRHGDRSAR